MPYDRILPIVLVAADLLLTVGPILIVLLLVAPLWLLLYLGVRALCAAHPTHQPLAWVRGVLAWGIVAAHAEMNPRYRPVARWRLFWALNGALVLGVAFMLRPDLGIPLFLFSLFWLAGLGLIANARPRGRHAPSKLAQTP